MSFIADKIVMDGLTYDDVLLIPAYSEVLPKTVELTTKFSRNIELKVPFVTAAMDTVTEAKMAIAIAREGGIGVIHKNMSIEEQARQVAIVKRAENGMIYDPVTIKRGSTVRDALALMSEYRIGGIPVVDDKRYLVGIVTNRDLRFEKDMDKRIDEVMTKENIVTTNQSTDMEAASRILQEHKIEKLPVVDKEGKLVGLITYKDITKAKDKPIYAFNVLPRITPPPTLESDSKKMIKISRLIDEISIFENEDDIKLLADLKEDIKQEDLDIYLDLFRRNTALNKELINLAKEGIITKLVIGQDDGEDFGIPNMEKKSLVNYVHSLGISNDVVMITKGADEVALSLLANFVQTKTNYQPKVYVEYNDEKAMRTVMPFMAGSVGSTVEEKLVMANAKKVNSPQEAGLILYVFIGNDENMSTQRQSALKIKKYFI